LAYFFMALTWFNPYRGLSIQLITMPVLLFVTDQLFSSAERKYVSMSFFNSAMLLSIASIFYFNIIFYILFVFFLYFRLRGIYWRELVFVILGAALPYFSLFCLMYLFSSDISEYIASIKVLWQYKLVTVHSNAFLINITFLAILFLISSGQAMNQYVKMKIITRKFSVSFFVFFAFSLAFILLIPSLNRDGILYISAPLSFLFGFYFTTCRSNILNQVLFFLFLAGNIVTLVYSYI